MIFIRVPFCVGVLFVVVASSPLRQTPVCAQSAASTARNIDLLTVAEESDFQSTASYDEVMTFCAALADQSPRVHLTDFGSTYEDRKLPLLVVADPPVKDPASLRESGKLPVFMMANIHAGEVCGKAATLMLARDLAEGSNDDVLQRIVLLIAPIYNADGNERMSKENRRGQVGPASGMGQRRNMQGLDLNRDNLKLESPEAIALAKLITDWNPAILIDTHTTNGSHHRYTITYDGPRNPATPGDITAYVRDTFLPEVSKRLERTSSYKSFYYGNFDESHQQWESYPDWPRYTTHYFGMRGRLGILSEAYAYASFRDRVLATKHFLASCLEVARDSDEAIKILLKEAQEDVPQPDHGQPDHGNPGHGTRVAIQSQSVPLDRRFDILGYEEEENEEGKSVATRRERTYANVRYLGISKATHSVVAPYAYVIPAELKHVIENLTAHGVKIERIRAELQLETGQYRVTKIQRAGREFQGHRFVTLGVEHETQPFDIGAGDALVKVAQPLGALVVILLEPESQDGLATWNFFDETLEVGKAFPVVRLERNVPILTLPWDGSTATRPPERITPDVWYGDERPNLGGNPASGFRWLDATTYLVRGRKTWHRVDARTGAAQPFADVDRIREALISQGGIDREQARGLISQVSRRLSDDCQTALISHEGDLYTVETTRANVTRVTSTPEIEEVPSLSPDQAWVAFVRDNNLYSRNVANGQEYQLTTAGNRVKRYGKADWVYFEEVYNRSWKGYAFSPNSKWIAFMVYDDSPVREFQVIDHMTPQAEVETQRYPKAGDPIPRVRLGVVSTTGGRIQWMDLSRYSPDNMILTRFGWLPDSSRLYLLVQDRAQRWMDFNRADARTGAVTQLFRERSKYWVPDPGPLHFFEDDSFLVRSDKDGWRHLYRISASGEGGKQITKGRWEVRDVVDVDEPGGWVYFLGTRDSHLAQNLYRARLDGAQEVQRLTHQDGRHRVNLSPDRGLFIDSFSSLKSPTRVVVRETQGTWQRLLDDNPVPDLDKYALSELEFHEIELSDGYKMPLTLSKPIDFDPDQQYPVWIMTYGGPHAPTVSNSWSGGRRGYDQMLNELGIVVVHCDPRSASGQGPKSTWTAYRQLGVQETLDLEQAVDWLVRQGFVDAHRIGISGHSYGGYLTAYAMTHCEKFAAGIAGAPVTDWRNYDAFYTERYMDTPQENPEGYDRSSVLAAAEDLHGRLLLVHGGKDDNVHVQNTLQLARKLQEADIPFEMMIYPTNRHGIYGDHYNRLRLDFIRRTLLAVGDDHAESEVGR
jgi:dipeptidyl-peptidase-4